MISMKKREKHILTMGIIIIAIAGMYSFVIKPITTKANAYQLKIVKKQKELKDVLIKAREYQVLTRQIPKTDQNKNNTSIPLLPRLEKLIKSHGLSSHIDTMEQDQQNTETATAAVNITLINIQLKQLINLLRAVDSSKYNMRIQSLHISNQQTNSDKIDVNIAFTD